MKIKDLKPILEKIEIDGEVWEYERSVTPYHVYILLSNDAPIYIGYTKDLPQRIETHKKDKSFNSVTIAGSYVDKHFAKMHEKVLIDYAKTFGSVLNVFGGYKNSTIKIES